MRNTINPCNIMIGKLSGRKYLGDLSADAKTTIKHMMRRHGFRVHVGFL